VGGFPGYRRGEPLPSSLDIVLGRSPANTDPVLFTRKKGNYAYAGGGYQVAQLFVEDHSGEPFAETLRRLVLNPVGMARSSFSQPVDETALGPLHIVPAELEDGPLEGGWHNYPELAAAGLWTTAEDYARFALAVGRAYRGDKDAGLKPEVARAMLTPVDRDYGLGLSIISEGGQPVSFAHGGSNEGYKASFRASALEEDAVVVLTNHPAGGRFSDEIVRGAFVALAPEGGDGEVLSREPLTSEIAERCLGDYAREGGEDAVFELTQEEGRVYILEPEGRDELIHTGGGRFVLMSAGLDIDCLEDDRGPYLLAARSARFDRLEAGR
jgi:CubicO group peptidase (beta-lactamase class C family)